MLCPGNHLIEDCIHIADASNWCLVISIVKAEAEAETKNYLKKDSYRRRRLFAFGSRGATARKSQIETPKAALNLVYDASAPGGLRPQRLIGCLFNWLIQIQFNDKMPVVVIKSIIQWLFHHSGD